MTSKTWFPRLNNWAAGFSAALVSVAITASAQNFPFPQHVTYTAGTIKPSNVTQATMDNSVISKWNTWKSNYLKPAGTGKMYIKFNSAGETVSEAHGYGMLLTVYMAGADASAKTEFDSLYNYYKAHPSVNNSFLMAWKQNSSFQDIEGADSATDGDMDIAYALLLADKQWGSGGTINYLQAGKDIVNAIMQSDVNQTKWNLRLGDWATGTDANNTRPSDFMLEHLKAYKAATGDSRWDNVSTTCYNVINTLFANNSPSTGLIPDFVIPNGSSWQPAPANFLEGPHDGEYDYNSCRTPWRFTMDYLLTGDTRAFNELQKVNTWIKGKVSSNPSSIVDGYHLNGGSYGSFNSGAFYGPIGVAAMIDPAHQSWLNSCWSKVAGSGTEGYYEDSLKIIPMICMSGNYWMPGAAAPTPDFTVSATPSSRTITAGSSTTYTVDLGNVNAFSGSVSLTVSNLPSGASASFSPASVNPPGSSTLTITTTAGTATGTKTLTIRGTSGSLTHSTTVSLTVNAPSTLPPPWTSQDIGAVGAAGSASFSGGTFTLNASGADIWSTADEFHFANQSVSGDVDVRARVISVANTHAFAKAGVMIRETLAADSKHALMAITPGGTATFVRRGAVAATSTSSNLTTFNAPYWVRLTRVGNTLTAFRSADGVTWINQGSTNITMAASTFVGLALSSHADGTICTATFDNVTVTGPTPDFSISASPSSRTITVGNSTTYTVTTTAINGFSGSVGLSVSGLPADATASFSPASITGAGTSTLTVTTASTTPAMTSTLTITGTSGALTHSTSVSLVTQAAPVPDFSISASPGSQTVTAGNGTTYTATISAINGFSGTVDLTAGGLPSGATASFSPASVAGSGNSTLTITTATNTPAGTSTLTLTGTSGTLTHSTTVSLVVNSATSGPLLFEAEDLVVMTNGAVIAAAQIDTNASNGEWVLFNGNGTGDWVQFTLPNVPAGTYTLKMDYKKNNNRGIIQLSVDGVNVGPTLDQYASPSTYTATTFGNVTLAAGNHTVRLTVTGKNASSSSFTVAADLFTLTPTTVPPPTVTMEAESLPLVASGGTTQITTDANASAGAWLQFNSDGVGDFIDLTTTSLPAGTYQVQFKYKTNTTRGQHTVLIDGAQVGGTIDQYAASPTYPTVTLGTVTFSTAGTHTLHLEVTGKNASSSNFLVAADAFTFVGQ